MKIKYIDYHAHLADNKYKEILDEHVKNIQKNKTYVLVTGSGYKDNQKTLDIAKKYNFKPLIAIQPQEVDDNNLEDFQKLLEKNIDEIVGIGECGLDLYWRQDNLEKQIKYLKFQIELAIKYDLPLVIHGRNAYQELYNLLIEYKGKIKGSIHCYDGSLELALKFVNDLDFYIGITGIATFKNSKISEVIKMVPLNRLLVETDSPYLTPEPFRGKINRSDYVLYIIEKISCLKNIDFNKVRKQIFFNTLNLFSKIKFLEEFYEL